MLVSFSRVVQTLCRGCEWMSLVNCPMYVCQRLRWSCRVCFGVLTRIIGYQHPLSNVHVRCLHLYTSNGEVISVVWMVHPTPSEISPTQKSRQTGFVSARIHGIRGCESLPWRKKKPPKAPASDNPSPTQICFRRPQLKGIHPTVIIFCFSFPRVIKSP